MSRKLFGPGAHGEIVGQIQMALQSAGFDPGAIDGKYGEDTLGALIGFQRSSNLLATGFVDDDTWKALLKQPAPGPADRCLQLTTDFEGNDYTLAQGNFDGAWMTWGIVGFTMKHGEIQRIVLEVYRCNPALLDQAFGVNADELVRVCQADPITQKAWANRNTVPGGNLAQPWRNQFALFGNLPEVRSIQRQRSFEDYFKPALRTSKLWGLSSELGVALCFDIHVQNGGISDEATHLIRSQMQVSKPQTERGLREIICNAVADAVRPEYRDDVRARKATIARGFGNVHGRDYLLENWGLADITAQAVAA